MVFNSDYFFWLLLLYKSSSQLNAKKPWLENNNFLRIKHEYLFQTWSDINVNGTLWISCATNGFELNVASIYHDLYLFCIFLWK